MQKLKPGARIFFFLVGGVQEFKPGCGVTIAGVARSQNCPGGGGNKTLLRLLL